MQLRPHIQEDLTFILESCRSGKEALAQAAQKAAASLEGVEADSLLKDLESREAQYPTATREGVAFPHVLVPGLGKTVIVVCLLRPSVQWSDAQETPQELVFLMIGPDERPWEHLRLLAHLARIVSTEGALDRLRQASDASDLFSRLLHEDQDHG